MYTLLYVPTVHCKLSKIIINNNDLQLFELLVFGFNTFIVYNNKRTQLLLLIFYYEARKAFTIQVIFWLRQMATELCIDSLKG